MESTRTTIRSTKLPVDGIEDFYFVNGLAIILFQLENRNITEVYAFIIAKISRTIDIIIIIYNIFRPNSNHDIALSCQLHFEFPNKGV